MDRCDIAIVGSGFSGIGMAIRLKQEGWSDFVVLERADDIGGTWREQTYPGSGCDIASRVYSFSFAPHDWQSTISSRGEIHEYLRDCAERFGVTPHVRLNCDVTAADWDEQQRRWHITTSQGELSARVLIQATGPMSEPVIPALPGLDRFQGTMFHSARWNHDHAIDGKRVAVIGTGSSGAQIIPAIQPRVARLVLMQRTPAWVAPKLQRRTTAPERWFYRKFPAAQRSARVALFAMYESLVLALRHPRLMRAIGRAIWSLGRMQIRDPELRRKLRPTTEMGCKRMVRSNDFYPALGQPNVDVVNSPIAEIAERSIVAADGTRHDVDTIVFATGFRVSDPPILERIRGKAGLPLSEVWKREGTRALRGTTVAGCPNLFILVGPNTGTGNNSLVFMIESQVAYVLDALRTMSARGLATVEPRTEAVTSYNERVQSLLAGTVWQTGCSSYYFDRDGRNVVLWPDFMFRFRRETRAFDADEYLLHPQ